MTRRSGIRAASASLARTTLEAVRDPLGNRNIVDDFERIYSTNPMLYVTEVHERLVPEPLAALRMRFEWSELKSTSFLGLPDDTECCSAPSVGIHRILQP